jgi:hypothetical protein
MRTIPTLVPVFAALFAIPLLATAAHHEKEEAAAAGPEPIAWDQARVADLAGQLSKHSEDMRQAVRMQSGTESVASGQSRATDALIDDLRGLRVECNRLKKEVEGGKGRDDTANNFRRIDEMHRDAAEELRRMFLSEKNIERVKKGRALLEELRVYYTGKTDDRPDLVGPKKGGDEKSK